MRPLLQRDVSSNDRSLPARVMAYSAIGMALHSEGSYEDILAQPTDGLSWTTGWEDTFDPPSRSAIFQARPRLGPEPSKAIFDRVATPLGHPNSPSVWLAARRGWSLSTELASTSLTRGQ